MIELHSGSYADARGDAVQAELVRLREAADKANELGLHLAVGHGLDYRNVIPVRGLRGLEEVNIGHSIVSRAIYVGLRQAVREMKDLLGD